MARAWIGIGLVWLAPLVAIAGDVTGRVVLPETCSPAVSPAVIWLTPKSGTIPPAGSSDPAQLKLIHQKGLMFEPRVLPLAPGQAMRFTNLDPETHNVHILGTPFNRSMSPGVDAEFLPEKAGVYKVVCDVHAHMRAFVIAAPTPWVASCDREGKFFVVDVPPGDYAMTIWHEIGNEPITRDVTVEAKKVDVGTITIEGPTLAAGSFASQPVQAWSEIIDRISQTYAKAADAATQPNGKKAARRLAEDAYYAEFEASGMETAAARYLGLETLGGIERRFRDLIKAHGKLESGQRPPTALNQQVGLLLLDLNKAAEELVRQGVPDRRAIDGKAVASTGAVASSGDRWARLATLRRSFDAVREIADKGEADDAASALSDVYFDAFEPLERDILGGEPGTVPVLEAHFNAIRGKIGAGLHGQALADELNRLHDDTSAALERIASASGGAFGAAFLASLFTIVREGTEVLLILAMLVALAKKTGRPESVGAIRWGFGLGIVASLATAYALNLLVASVRGRAAELVEGVVMLAAAGILFYVSYWLISQSESKRWLDFLKRQVQQSGTRGGLFALGLTSFVAVYREGAETALIYQAMIGNQAGRAGSLGLLAGLMVGLVLLGGVYFVLRTATVKLPLRAFFAVTGVALFAMSVVFAGKGVFELQQAQVLKVTPVDWLGNGLPLLGLYPNLQVVSIQGLLIAGAVLAAGLMAFDRVAPKAEADRDAVPKSPTPTANVGA